MQTTTPPATDQLPRLLVLRARLRFELSQSRVPPGPEGAAPAPRRRLHRHIDDREAYEELDRVVVLNGGPAAPLTD